MSQGLQANKFKALAGRYFLGKDASESESWSWRKWTVAGSSAWEMQRQPPVFCSGKAGYRAHQNHPGCWGRMKDTELRF